MIIRRTFEAAILTELYPRSQIDIFVQVSLSFLPVTLFENLITLKKMVHTKSIDVNYQESA